MQKRIALSIIVATIIIAGALLYGSASRDRNLTGAVPATESGGVQVIDIAARAGYTPRLSVAKAGVETVLRVSTKETYDCSVSLVIPKLKYQKFLPPNGVEEIRIPAAQAKGTLNGLCSMGMYSFKIVFQD